MKAIRVKQSGGPEVLKVEEIEIAKPKEGEAIVSIKAAGVNFIDVQERRGTYRASMPYTPGYEASGVVESVGEGVSNVKVGDRVTYVRQPGSYAEKNLVQAENLIPLPPGLSFEQGAAFPMQGMTAHYLLHGFYKVKPGDTVLIHAAAGGVGRLLVQWARHLGARVFGTVSTEVKAKQAKEAGADEVFLYTKQDFVAEILKLTNKRGVDLILDGIGKTTFPGNLEAAALRGNIIIYGSASGKADPISPNQLMRKSLTVSGGDLFNFILNREELLFRAEAVIEGIQKGWLKLHIENAFPLIEAPEAHQMLENRNSVGKLLLCP